MRIIYGVNSEGMGHATRSSVVIDHLQAKGHEVHIFASGRVYEFLAKKYEHTYQIKGFNLVYKDDKLLNMHSFFTVLRNLPKGLIPTFRTLAQKFAEIEPHVVISDFEFFTAFIAKNIGTPVISANNISLMSKGKIDPSLEFKHLYSRFFAKNTDTWASFRADQYVIPTFFFPQTRKKNVILTNPAIRQKIQQAKVATKDHVLVYHTSPTFKDLLKLLNKLDETFYVYGFGKKRARKHLTFFNFSEDGFIQHLASAKAVIIGGGLSLMSEAIYLKKPVFSVPLRNHYEQIMNAYYLQKLKFGEHHQKPQLVDVHDFLLKLDLYQHYLGQYNFDPSEFPRKVEQVSRKAKKEPSRKRLRALQRILFAQ